MLPRSRYNLLLLATILLRDGGVVRADRAALLKRQAAVQAAKAADEAAIAAAEAAVVAEAEAAAKEKMRASAAALKHAREAAAHSATLAASAEAAALLRPRSRERNSFEFHKTRQYLVRTAAENANANGAFSSSSSSSSSPSSSFCMSLPRADRKAAHGKRSWRNGMAVVLAPCNTSDTMQFFSHDAVSGMIHPEDSKQFCLDFDFDNKDLRPLTVFRCDKTFSRAAKPRHQSWDFSNGSAIKNRGTGSCIAVGPKNIYDGLAVRTL